MLEQGNTESRARRVEATRRVHFRAVFSSGSGVGRAIGYLLLAQSACPRFGMGIYFYLFVLHR